MLTFNKYILIIIFVNNINCVEVCTNKPIHNFEYLFAHGLAAGKKQLAHYFEIIPIIGKGLAFDCIDATTRPLYPSIVKIPPTAFGQEKDIAVLTGAIKNIDMPIIGIGVSKGAACWINAAAEKQNIDKLAALVLESPFANVNEVIQKFKFVDYLNYIPCGQFIAKHGASKILCHYDPNGIQPIDSIKNITNKSLPIFLIHSKQDRLIPINHSRRLYIAFLKNGFTNAYLVETETGRHANILSHNPDKMFQKTIHSFYKKFNLPYDANAIHYDINKFQPTIEEVEQRIKGDTHLIDEYLPLIIRSLILLLLLYLFLMRYPILPKIY